jgi:hypothetical protein
MKYIAKIYKAVALIIGHIVLAAGIAASGFCLLITVTDKISCFRKNKIPFREDMTA